MTIKITGADEVTRAPLLDLKAGSQPDHSEDFLSGQAARLHLALGENSPGFEEVSSAMSSGNTDGYKQLLVDQDRINQIERRNNVLSSILQTDPSMITPEMVSTVHGLSEMEINSPALPDIIEKKYAKVYTDTAVSSLDNGIVDEAMDTDPETSMEMMDRSEVLAYKYNYAATKLDEAKKAIENSSWLSWGYNLAENFVIGQYQQYDQVDTDFVSAVLPGANKEEQYAYLWGLSDPNEFKETLDTAISDLKERNPLTLQQWLQGLFSYGGSEAAMESLTAGIDIASVIPAGKLASALKGIVKGSVKNPIRLYEVSTELGKNADAAVGKIIEDLKTDSLFGQNIKNIKELENSIPSISSPEKLLSGSQNVPQAAYLRMKEQLLKTANLAQKFLLEPNLVDRATPDELLRYKDTLLRDYVRDNPSIQKNVIDVEIAEQGDVGNVYQAKVILGKRSGELFESEKQAENYFKKFIGGTNDYKITQKGEGFQIEILKNVDETKLNSFRLGTTQQTPESLSNTFAGWLRSPDYLVSGQQVEQRAVASSSTELLRDIFGQMTEPFRTLPSKELNELQDLMVNNRTSREYYKNYGEFEQAFFMRFNKLPSEAQSNAYFTYVQINDLDLVVRDLDVYKQKARLGLESFSIKDVDQNITFEGKLVESLPRGSKDFYKVSVLDQAASPKASKPVSSKYLTEKDFERFEKLKSEGYRIIQVADQALSINDDFVGFLIVKEFKRDRIGVKNFERQAGGHKVHTYPYYIKQGKFIDTNGQNLYKGDHTLWNFRSEKEANEFLKTLEEARIKLLRNDKDAMKFIRDNVPGIDTKGFAAMIKDGMIDLKIPFAVTKKGLRTLDTGKYSNLQNIVDLQKNEHNLASKIQGRYLGERSESDLSTIRSEEDALFQIEGAPYLSPLETLQVSSSNMLQTRLVNDYSLSTRQNFLREFSDILDGTKEELETQGMSVLTDPVFKVGAPPSKVAAAKNVSRAYNQFLNMKTFFEGKIEVYKEKLLSDILPKFGPRGQQWVEDKMLSRVKDPGVFLRSTAFHMKLGLFNVKQMFVQLNTMVNVSTIAGVNGLKGTALFPIMRGALMSNSPEVLARFAKVAENVGLMKSDDFIESMGMLRRSGWNNVGGDLAYLDDLRAPEIRKGPVRRAGNSVLQWGLTPFQEGERAVRLAAWQAAYLERKALKKGGKLTKQDETQILVRAKNLNANMTRESNAAWQKGYPAVITQFFGYQARIMEQFLGKKLTNPEKARLFTAYSAIYGAPVAVGATTGVIPVRQIVREMMYEQGVDPDDPSVEPFIDGFASAAIEYMTGKDLNIADRYGPGGLPTIYDMFRTDKSMAEILLGASGGIGMTTVSDFWKAGWSMASEFSDFEGGYFNVAAEDLTSALRNISTVDDVVKLWNVYNTQVWASKNGTSITEMDLPDGIIAVLTGLQPGRIEDSFAKISAMKDLKEYKKTVQKEMIRDYRLAMKMDPGKEREVLIKRIKSRMIIEGFTLREMQQTWEYALDKEMMTDSVFENYEKIREQMENRL